METMTIVALQIILAMIIWRSGTRRKCIFGPHAVSESMMRRCVLDQVWQSHTLTMGLLGFIGCIFTGVAHWYSLVFAMATGWLAGRGWYRLRVGVMGVNDTGSEEIDISTLPSLAGKIAPGLRMRVRCVEIPPLPLAKDAPFVLMGLAMGVGVAYGCNALVSHFLR